MSTAYKLNRVQRKELIRELQGIVLNRVVPIVTSKADYPPLREWNEKAAHVLTFRQNALKQLLERGNEDEVYETLRAQIAINPEDTEMNTEVMNTLMQAYDAGAADKD